MKDQKQGEREQPWREPLEVQNGGKIGYSLPPWLENMNAKIITIKTNFSQNIPKKTWKNSVFTADICPYQHFSLLYSPLSVCSSCASTILLFSPLYLSPPLLFFDKLLVFLLLPCTPH